jgi:phosphatidylethanolamine/phosphatidyl-N-methylethanolamine N-methyltransferase
LRSTTVVIAVGRKNVPFIATAFGVSWPQFDKLEFRLQAVRYLGFDRTPFPTAYSLVMPSQHRVFLKQFFRQYHTTGALLPSGRRLASALCRYLRDDGKDDSANGGRKILEVGPGTGAVTQCMLRYLKPDDHLTLIELNDDFVRHLNDRFAVEAAFKTAADRCQLVHGRLEELKGEHVYDRIVSGLPLNNFAAVEVEQILKVFARLIKPDGVLSFFEYIAMRRVKQVLSRGSERQRLREISRLFGELTRQHEIRCDWVWLNFTPAWVHHIRFDGAGSSRGSEGSARVS